MGRVRSRTDDEARRGRTVDERGRVVPMLDPVALHMLHRHDVIEANALQALAEAIGPGVAKGQKAFFWTCFVLGAAGLVAAMIRAFGYGFGIDAVGRILWVINAACLGIGVLGIWQRGRRGRLVRVRRIMLAHRRCPHCGYDLVGLPIEDEDGTTVCPECGCAWRLEADRRVR